MIKKINYIVILPILILVLYGCQKQCVQCKTQFRTYLMYKSVDTVVIEAYGRDEDIRNELNVKLYDGYNFIGQIKDSIYYENYCSKKEIYNLKLQTYDKKYCYPK